MQKSVLLAVLVLIPMSYAQAQIPDVERDALIALYNATNGAGWTNNFGWTTGTVGMECTWYGVTCAGGHVQRLRLNSNQLSGVIPPGLGSLSSLWFLELDSNQLSGSIPPELGNLLSLTDLDVGFNELSGVIPPGMGSLSSLIYLHAGFNQLSGNIPPELGNLSSLQELYLNSNQLSGNIPTEFENLSALFGGQLNLRWNALHSDNVTLIAFLNSKQEGGDWQSTQTIAPENLAVDSVGDHTVWLSWDAVSYQTDPGGYSVFSAPTGTGVWTTGGWTEAKTDTTYPVTGLDPATSYDLAVVSYTDPHPNNLNLVNSDFSPDVMATTASAGCAQPIIEVAWGDPITLSVSGSYDSYLWITGETTSTIDIDPPWEQWYWVTVTSSGSCEETSATSVDPATLFADGFESGSTSAWSALAPRCGDLTELRCINSGECTLILIGEMTGEYVCRPAEGPCEPGFRQRSDTAESCEAKNDCSFFPGVCYCPPDLVCICGGGPPPQCMES